MKRIRKQNGFSMVESLVSLFFLGILGALAFEIMIGTSKTNVFLESQNELSAMSQKGLNQIKDQLNRSHLLLDRSERGLQYLAKLDLSGYPQPLHASALPEIQSNGSHSPYSDGFDPMSIGNSLLFAMGEPVFRDATTATRVDVYSFHYYYLAQHIDRPLKKKPGTLELMDWSSILYVDASQILALEEAERITVVTGLREEGITGAWIPGGEADTSFYELLDGGNLALQQPGYHIESNECLSAIRSFRGGRISGSQIFTVSYNTGRDFQTSKPVPLFAIANNISDGFPHGFEVGIVGPSGGRQVHMRLVLASASGAFRNIVAVENVMLAQARDF